MKNILLMILFFTLPSKHVGKMNHSNDYDISLKVEKIIGTKDDIKKILYLLKDDTTIKHSNIVINYNRFFFNIKQKKKLIGMYFITEKGGLRVNNFNPMRDKVSYRDTTEREYRLKIEQKEGKLYILKFTNYGETYKLSGEVTILAHKDE